MRKRGSLSTRTMVDFKSTPLEPLAFKARVVQFPWIAIPRQRRQLLSCRATEQPLERSSRHLRQLPNGIDADLGQPRLGDRTHSPMSTFSSPAVKAAPAQHTRNFDNS